MNSEPKTATRPLRQTSEESFQNRRQIKTTKSKKGLGRNRWQFKKLKEILKKKKEKAYIIIFRDKEIIHDSRKELK